MVSVSGVGQSRPLRRCSDRQRRKCGNGDFEQVVRRNARLALNFHAFPKRDVVLDLGDAIERLRVIPSRSFIHLVVDHDVVITGRPFPGTDRCMAAWTQAFLVDALVGKVVISFDLNRFIAVGKECAVPGCVSHGEIRGVDW